MFKALGALVYKGRWIVLILAIAGSAAAAYFGLNVFNRLDTGGFTSNNFESYQAQQTINDQFGNAQSLIVLLSSGNLKVTDPAFRQAAEQTLDKVRGDRDVTGIIDYYHTSVPKLVSRDGRSTYAVINLKGSAQQAMAAAKRLRPQLSSSTLTVDTGGEPAVNADITAQVGQDLAKAEVISFIVLAVLLVIVFRSLVAAALPLLLGAFGVLGAFLVVDGITYLTTISQYSINVITLLGLGLSIDYSLFMVSRFREELRQHPTQQALTNTMRTAGRTVFFSGVTVILSLLGLLVFPIGFLKSMGYGASAAVGVAVLGALTVLPAILAMLGNKINSLSFGQVRADYLAIKRGHTVTRDAPNFWSGVARFAMRYPVLTIGLVVLPLVFMGQFVLQVKFSSADYRILPTSASSRRVADALGNDFAGNSDNPIQVVIHTDSNAPSPADLGSYAVSLKSLAGVTSVSPMQAKPVPHYAVLNVGYNSVYDQPLARDLVTNIRTLNLPAGWNVQVGGQTASLVDLLSSLRSHAVYAAIMVAGALVILLFIMLRSAVVPLEALVVNILSLSAAFGILVWVFQQGHLTRLLDFQSVGALDATQPVLIFSIAFGLSMDYSVFLLSRIKEEYEATGDNAKAIMEGVHRTGSIITSAALLFIVVVGAFATSKIELIKEIGIGLGLAVFIDAFLIRMLLVPALMGLIGRLNWWPHTRRVKASVHPKATHPQTADRAE
ncbi:MAG TPA: MMPL family transporter [Candidatus Saccharimonadia bacterium]|jgi:RND superfamily putative drug exporter